MFRVRLSLWGLSWKRHSGVSRTWSLNDRCNIDVGPHSTHEDFPQQTRDTEVMKPAGVLRLILGHSTRYDASIYTVISFIQVSPLTCSIQLTIHSQTDQTQVSFSNPLT